MATASLILNLIVRGDPSGISSIGAVGTALNGVAIAAGAVALGLGAAISSAADFDLTMRQVGAATETSGAALQELSDLALQMGADTSFSAAAASDAMLALARGGMTAAQIQGGALEQTLVLAAAGSLELGQAADYMVTGLNMFGLAAADSARVAAALAGGANASTASVESLGLALSQVGPGARNAGVSLEETVGVLAAFANAGIQGSDAGTSFKTMLTRLVPSTAEAADAMGALGLSFVDAAGNVLPMRDVAQQLQDKLGGMSEAQRIATLNTIFGSDATRAATVLMNEGAAGIDSYVAATSDLAAAQNMAAVNTSGAAGAFEQFKGSVETLGLKIGLVLLPAVESITRAATDMVNSLGRAFDGLDFGSTDGIAGRLAPIGDALAGVFASLRESWSSWIQPTLLNLIDLLDPLLLDAWQVVLVAVRAVAEIFEHVLGPAIRAVTGFLADHETIVGAIVVTVGTFAAILGTVSLAISGTIAVIAAINAALAAMSVIWGILTALFAANPIGIAIIAIAALAAGLIYAYQHSETFRNIVTGAFDAVRDVISGTWNALKGAFDWVRDHWQELAILLTGPFGVAFLLIRSQIDNIRGAVSGIWDGITAGGGAVVDAVVGVFTGIAGAVRDGINTVLSVIGNPFASLFSLWISGIGGVADLAYDLFYGIFHKFVDAVNHIIDLWNSIPILPDLGHVPDVGFMAEGGVVAQGGMSWVGEMGPELLELPTGAKVTPLDRVGTGGGEVHVTTYVDFTGVGMDALITALREGIKVRGGDVVGVLGTP